MGLQGPSRRMPRFLDNPLAAPIEQDSSALTSDTFTRFTHLPPEISTKIWKHALCDATANRKIKVAVYYQYQVTMLCSHPRTERFCGHHSGCQTCVHGRPLWNVSCMKDGYFASTRDFPEPEDEIPRQVLSSLGLACRESRSVVLSRYPQPMRVYRGEWHSGADFRIVRCNPALDTLIITAITDVGSLDRPQPGFEALPGYQSTCGQWRPILVRFPQDVQLFSAFRRIVSSFLHVGFRHIGSRLLLRTSDPFFDEPPRPNDDLDFMKSKVQVFMLFLESVKALYLWPDPLIWPEIRDGAIRVDDVKHLQRHKDPSLRSMFRSSYDALSDYNELADRHITHYASSSQNRAPKPQKLERIGYYVAPPWLDINFQLSNDSLKVDYATVFLAPRSRLSESSYF